MVIYLRPDWRQTATALVSIVSVLLVAAGLLYSNAATRGQLDATRSGQIAERFTKAIDQLGQEGADKLSIRLGGIYALERLMRDSPEDQAAIIEVLCEFVRSHAVAPKRKPAPVSTSDVQTAVIVLGRRPNPDAPGNRLNLYGAHLVMPRADLAGANLRRAYLKGADLAGANLTGAVLTDANMANARLDDADLMHADLERADLTGANLSIADLTDARLISANLAGADLGHANLVGAGLTHADLTGAWLGGADLAGASLSPASLIRAELAQANLAGADLAHADVTEANLGCVHTDGETRLPDGYVLRTTGDCYRTPAGASVAS